MNNYQIAAKILARGGIIAYPTEAVFGLGCDPFNARAVMRLLELKEREVEKGLILIAASWGQVKTLVAKIPDEILEKVLATWPGPNTWVLPASKKAPVWIKGAHSSIAIRVTAHKVARAICEEFSGPIVSTSANLTNFPPARTRKELLKQFPCGIDFVVAGRVGRLKNPTPIKDAITAKILR
jgi:L-threonylcarbamoyladenylate synthase